MSTNRTSKNNLKVQVVSDMHMEMAPKGITLEHYIDIHDDTELLIIPGDMHNEPVRIADELDRVSQEYNIYIIFVPGNHEYYTYPVEYVHSVFEMAKNSSEKVFYFYGDNPDNTVFFRGVQFTGYTLWSELENADIEDKLHIQELINDFSLIYENKQDYIPVSFDTVANWSHTHKQRLIKTQRSLFFEDFLNETETPHVVITHFPVKQRCSHPDFKDSNFNPYYKTDFDLQEYNNIDIWISGHTHYNNDFIEDDVRFVSNQSGYKSEILVNDTSTAENILGKDGVLFVCK